MNYGFKYIATSTCKIPSEDADRIRSPKRYALSRRLDYGYCPEISQTYSLFLLHELLCPNMAALKRMGKISLKILYFEVDGVESLLYFY
jgi:hypothetical protein